MSIFDSVQTPNPGYNKFDLSYTNSLTTKMGDITPIYMEHLLPGDKIRVKSNLFARLMPLATPAFGNLRMIVRYFFVPYRLLFSSQDSLDPRSFDYFITGGTSDGGKTQLYQPYFPKYSFSNIANSRLNEIFYPGSIHDFLGVNVNVSNTGNSNFEFSALPYLAYNRIYNDWYRDETIDEPYPYFITEDITDPINNSSMIENFFSIRRARWHKDYFTSALISPTNGAPEQALPLVGGDMTVLGDFATDLYKPAEGKNGIVTLNSDGKFNFIQYDDVSSTQNNIVFESDNVTAQGPLNSSGTPDGLYADAANQYMASIRDLRNSIATQRFLEISARGGNRYIEQIFAHFGVRSLDARLQRAEFLGGGITPINIGEVLQTSETANTPLGEMGGRGVAYGTDNKCNYYATEHGILMGLMTIQPEAVYFQGISRHYKKFDRLDYYWPSFAHIGDQEIKYYEIYNDTTSGYSGFNVDMTFGYAPRYAEYKNHLNELHGEFKDSMSSWTFAQKFANVPNLNSEFLEVPNITNPFANTDEDSPKYIIHISHKVDALRKMPYYGNPSLIG